MVRLLFSSLSEAMMLIIGFCCKVRNTKFFRPGNHAPEDVQEDLCSALKDLRLDYVDLYLVNSCS
jgi:aryl-alcohol dehydrogenase-like predicted oxidoreductase